MSIHEAIWEDGQWTFICGCDPMNLDPQDDATGFVQSAAPHTPPRPNRVLQVPAAPATVPRPGGVSTWDSDTGTFYWSMFDDNLDVLHEATYDMANHHWVYECGCCMHLNINHMGLVDSDDEVLFGTPEEDDAAMVLGTSFN